jgi:hypothetical protein
VVVPWRVQGSPFETGQQWVNKTPEEFGLVRCAKPSDLGAWSWVPAYSTTGDGLLLVIEKMRERGFDFHADCNTLGWDVQFFNDDVGTPHSVDGDVSLPRAVCLAALRALWVEGQA